MSTDRAHDGMADVLIIGAGASGGVAGLRLAQAGLSVVALEQGDWHDREEYRGSEWDWELAAGKPWSSLANVRRGLADYPIDTSRSDIEIMNFNGVGGGTILFNAIWIRLLAENFRSRSLYGVTDDWPIDYAELQPWFEAVDAQVGVSGLGGNPVYPPGADPPLPPLPFGPGAMRVARALHARGWHWWPDTNAIISAPYGSRHPCVGRGTCAQGCNEGAKSSVDHTHWSPFAALGGRLITGARVKRIVLDDDGLACGAIWIDRQGAEHFQAAGLVLCAANGIGTPRLLLNSACERFPSGLANSSDLVGRRLMMHPVSAVVGVFEEQLEAWQGHNGSTVQSLEFGLHDASRGFFGGAKWSLHPIGGGPVQTTMKLIAGGAQGDAYHEAFAHRFGHEMMWSVMCEDAPDPENRVVLSPDLVDSSGIPAPAVIYATSEDSRKNLDWNVERAARIFREAGARDVDVYNPAGQNAHFMGAARMGDDPRNSVVDRWCMTHDVPNLGIIDGSVFVTSGPLNPTSTICALALRAADRLARDGAAIPRPRRVERSFFGPRSAEKVEPVPALTPPSPLTAAERDRLAALGDAFIPPVEDLPGAGTVALSTELLDKVLASRPDLLDPIRRAAGTEPQLFASLLASDPEAWSAAVTALSAAYYADRRVQDRVGYHGQTPRPQTPERYPPYVAEGLLDHVLQPDWRERWARGPADMAADS